MWCIAFAVVGLLGCAGHADDTPARCTCTPTQRVASSRASASILELVHRHEAAVRDGQRNGRNTKLIDDELRLQSSIVCEPCGAWIGERATPEDIYPEGRTNDAVGIVCAGLQLRDGTIAYGEAHPRECR